jgi:fatty acid desaturase
MNAMEAIHARPEAPPVNFDVRDDTAMLRAAVDLTRDISAARASIYWPDMLLSAGLGYVALVFAILADGPWMSLFLGAVSALALYRASLFIHELTHIHRDSLPGFRLAWNLLVGIPMLMPSLLYENVHTLHHARTRYGTVEDPEYLPLALMRPWTLPLFILIALLLPIGLLVRSGLLVPLGIMIPPLRRLVWEHLSALTINPHFRRRPAEGAFARTVAWQEAGASLWAMALIGASAAWGWRPLLIGLGVASATAVLNQLRTLVAHLWQNDGDPMTVTAQYLDSVNVPPPGWLAELWAPVGLRYHAVHHLLPSLPYHALGEAYRRLLAQFGNQSTFARASYPGMATLVGRIVSSTMGGRRH